MNKRALNNVLRQAAIDGDPRAARIAIAKGADIEARGWDGKTALLLAAWYGHTDIVRLLLDAGATFTPEDRSWLQQEAANGDAEVRAGLAAIDVWQAEKGAKARLPGRPPTPLEVLAARTRAGLTQAEAAKLVYSSRRQWQRWEAGEHTMHPAKYRMFVEAVGGDQK